MVDITASMQGVAEAIVKFANFGITIVTVLFVWQVIMLIRGPEPGVLPEKLLTAAGEKVKGLRKAGRQGKRAAFKVYRLDKKLEKHLDKLGDQVAAKTKDPKKISSLLKDGREELKKEGELLNFLDDVEKKIAAMSGTKKTKMDVIHKGVLAAFESLKTDYETLEEALGKSDWTGGSVALASCKKSVRKIAQGLPALEAVWDED